MRSKRRAHLTQTILIVILSSTLFSACNDQAKTSSDLSRSTPRGSAALQQTSAVNTSNEPAPYFGEDWAEQRAPGSARHSGSGLSASPSGSSNAIYSLVIGTYTGTGHAEAAHEMIANLRMIAPQVIGLRVHTTPRGSMVVYGNYRDREDPTATTDQERLKSIMYQGRPLFNRVILTRLDLRLTHGQLHPHDLLSARRQHPKVNPLYTLDVAIWMTNDDPKARDRITFEEVRRKAESYAAELRARNEQAYFYHDEVNQWSTVTVGLFDRRAIDQRSGIFSEEVNAVMRRYPSRLVNGEPLLELNDPRDPKKGGKPQQPKLVLVPAM